MECFTNIPSAYTEEHQDEESIHTHTHTHISSLFHPYLLLKFTLSLYSYNNARGAGNLK